MKCLIVIFVCAFTVNCENIENFYKYVIDTINEINNYTKPRNNSQLYHTSDSKIYDAGSYDFIIVGAGSSGTVLASRLTEIQDWKVLLLEAGGQESVFSDVPGFSAFLETSNLDWGYYTSPQKTCCQGMVDNRCVYPRGKVLGGSSVTNAMIYARGNREDFDEWERLGNPEWSYKDVLPYFKKSERVDLSTYDASFHGKNGTLHVNFTSAPSKVADSFIQAAQEAGLRELDPNGREQIGVSKMQFNINFNKRCSGSHAFIDPIRTRKNLQIETEAYVVKILINGDKANGVQYIKNEQIYQVSAKKEIVLSAGAVNTPQLLLLSGLGPKEELTKLGINVKVNLPAVGRNLQDHTFFLNFVIRTNVTIENATLLENLRKYEKGEAPLTRAKGGEMIGFLHTTDSKSPYPDIELMTAIPSLPVNIQPVNMYNLKSKFVEVFNDYGPTDFFGVVITLKPKSRGTITLKSNSPLDFPLINVNYFSDPENYDMETMYRGLKFFLNLTQTNAFKKINATYISKQPECEHLLQEDCKNSRYQNDCDRKYWECAIRRLASTTYHPVGTAKMGPSAEDSVVDHNGLVHKLRNLRIVDTSIMPIIVRGHTNAACYMIAEKISDKIKKKHNK